MEKRTSVGRDHEILLGDLEILLLLLFQILLLRFQILGLFGLLLLQMLDLRALRFHLLTEWLYHTIGENVHGCFGGFGGQLVRFRLLMLVLRFRSPVAPCGDDRAHDAATADKTDDDRRPELLRIEQFLERRHYSLAPALRHVLISVTCLSWSSVTVLESFVSMSDTVTSVASREANKAVTPFM